MKKFFLLFFAVNFLHAHELSQDFLLDTLKNDFIASETYEKYKNVLARKAVAGEIIVTYTQDGLETQNTAGTNDYVVQNLTKAKEKYLVSEQKFQDRYEFLQKYDENLDLYKPKGKIKAIKVNRKLRKKLDIKSSSFHIITAWNEKMIVKDGDYLVAPPDFSEVYRIAKKEFFETYKKLKTKKL